MATKTIKKSESVIWLPPRSIGERAFASEPSLVALVHGPDGPRYSRLSIDALPAVRQATLVFDARDVTLLQVTLPPLSGAKLRLALPNAVEDRLLQDAQTCLFALGPVAGSDGARLLAVIDRSWLDFVVGAIERRGIRVLRALPAQLAMPLPDDSAAIVCVHDGLALRTGRTDGLGWSAGSEAAQRGEAINNALSTIIVPRDAPANGHFPDTSGHTDELRDEPSLLDAVPIADPPTQMPSTLQGLSASRLSAYVEDETWREPVTEAANRLHLHLRIETLPIPESGPVDLLDGRGGSNLGRRVADIDWRAWRMPAALALTSLAVFLLGLNLHWGKLATERTQLRADLEQRFRQTFPQATVVVDPVLQMERQVASMRASAGQSGPGDFVPLLTRFSQALGAQAGDALTSVEYRDGKLKVSFQPQLVAARSMRDNLQQACRRLGLDLRFETGRDSQAVVGLL